MRRGFPIGDPVMLKLLVQYPDGRLEPVDSMAFGLGTNIQIKSKVTESIERYLENVTSRKCPKNIRNEKMYFRSFLESVQVDLISEVKSYHVDQHRSDLLLKKLNPNTINRRFSVFNHFFNMCIEWELIRENPMKNLKQLKVEKNPRKVWPEEVFINVMQSLPEKIREMFIVLMLTGARHEEIKYMTRHDIDYEQRIIILRCQKNKNVYREFPLTEEIDIVLHALKMENNYIFYRNGKVISSDNMYQAVKHRLIKLGHNNLVPYGLRHTFANRLCKQGVNAFYIQKLLGHSNIATTLNYVNPDKKDLHHVMSTIKTMVHVKAN